MCDQSDEGANGLFDWLSRDRKPGEEERGGHPGSVVMTMGKVALATSIPEVDERARLESDPPAAIHAEKDVF